MRIRSGGVRVDTATRQVWRGSETVHLTKKAFDLLALFVSNRPNAVTKEAIHQHLWPDTFVSDASLQALVSEVRRALGDDGRRRAIVRTVHGVGYAFSADVEEEVGAAPERREVRAWLVAALDRIPLHAGENVLGRAEEGVTMVDDSTVSRRHARITVTDVGAILEDLDSKNGTWLCDQPVTSPSPLADGDVVCFGSASFTFRPAPPAGSTSRRCDDNPARADRPVSGVERPEDFAGP